MVYVITVRICHCKYYATDLKGSLSNSIHDSMIFLTEDAANAHIGSLERMYEERLEVSAIVEVMRTALSTIIPKAPLKRIASLGY